MLDLLAAAGIDVGPVCEAKQGLRGDGDLQPSGECGRGGVARESTASYRGTSSHVT